MPYLHLELQADEVKGPGGRRQSVPSAAALQMRGPIAQAAIHFPAAVAQELVNQGDVLPAPVVGDALIDTGASLTCIDNDVAKDLGLSPIDVANMHSASHADLEVPVYFASIQLLGMGARFELRAMGASLKAQGLVALIGRDALQSTVLFYNGPAGQITLVLP